MLITRFDTLTQFDQLQDAWHAAYVADPHTHIFVSWRWLRAWLVAAQPEWFGFSLQRDYAEAPQAFFLFRERTVRQGRFGLRRELYLGGKPHADYGGFVCHPDVEVDALASMAGELRRLENWDCLNIDDVLDPRLPQFVGALRREGAGVATGKQTACPFLELPEDWATYLQNSLSSKERKNLRYYTRKVEELPGFRATQAEADTFEAHLDPLLHFWQARWGRDPEGNRALLRESFRQGLLWLGGLWQASTPIAFLAGFVDEPKRAFDYYMLGFNPEFAAFSPGKVMVGYSIRYALEHGLLLFDFLRGDEDYKLAFGTTNRFVTSIQIAGQRPRPSLRHWLARLEQAVVGS